MYYSNKLVLITGGASGIGKIMGRRIIEQGGKLIIWDINTAGIESTIKEFSSIGNSIGYTIDLNDFDAIQKVAAKTKLEHGIPDLIINNAGIIVGKHFEDHTENEITATMNINATAPMLVSLAFLPEMIKRRSGHICNIASSAGLVSNPKMSVYAASKWALIGWSDSLRLEMERSDSNIYVTTVNPYYINTGMFSGVRSIIPILNPEKTADKILKAVEKKKVFLTLPLSMHLIRFLQGILPISAFDFIADKVLGIYSSMDDFKGRNNHKATN
jgi:all-trans-retinol dehydrogenase (NAD+)